MGLGGGLVGLRLFQLTLAPTQAQPAPLGLLFRLLLGGEVDQLEVGHLGRVAEPVAEEVSDTSDEESDASGEEVSDTEVSDTETQA